jgi:hypothetical protein
MAVMQEKMLASGLVLLAVLGSSSCSAMKQKKAADDAVTQFHAQLNEERYHEIYGLVSDDFHKATSEREFTELLAAVHHKLGAVETSSPGAWRINYNPSGTVVRANYETRFSEGKATEEFSWVISGNQTYLLRYHINSKELITK